MTMLEELTGIVLRIRELKARIDCSEDKEITWLEQLELCELRERLEEMIKEVKLKEVKDAYIS
jgi:hypothetical protein